MSLAKRLNYEKAAKQQQVARQGSEYVGADLPQKAHIAPKTPDRLVIPKQQPQKAPSAPNIVKRQPVSFKRLDYLDAVKRAMTKKTTPPAPFKKLGPKLIKEVNKLGAEHWARNQPEFSAIEDILAFIRKGAQSPPEALRNAIRETEQRIAADNARRNSLRSMLIALQNASA